MATRNVFVDEQEIRHKIEEALRISPKLTIAMLQAFLTSRISPSDRDEVLERMIQENKVRRETIVLRSMKGNSSSAIVIAKV